MKKYTHKELVTNLIKMIESEMYKSTTYSSFSSTSKYNDFWMRYSFPYESRKLKNGNILFLNRGYKPIFYFDEGFQKESLVDYEDFIELSFQSKNKPQYFYDDSTKPWNSKKNLLEYLEKIKIYLKEEVNNYEK